jgi:hypothetical protein
LSDKNHSVNRRPPDCHPRPGSVFKAIGKGAEAVGDALEGVGATVGGKIAKGAGKVAGLLGGTTCLSCVIQGGLLGAEAAGCISAAGVTLESAGTFTPAATAECSFAVAQKLIFQRNCFGSGKGC